MSFVGNLLGTNANNQYQNVVQSPGLQQNPFTQGYQQQGNALTNQGTGYLALANPGAQNQTAAQQSALAQALMAQSTGQNPGLAGALLKQAGDQSAAQTNALMASQNGMNPALAARTAMTQNANNAQAIAQQSAQAGLQQQLQSQGLLSQLLGTQRSQDISNAGLYGQLGLGSQQLGQGYQGLGLQAAQSDLQGALNADQMNTSLATSSAQSTGGLLGGIFGGVGSVLSGGGGKGKAKGGRIPGKATVPGDSPANDTVPIMASPGEIVIPRSKASDPEKAKEFVKHIMKKKGGSDAEGFGKVVQAKRKRKALEEKRKDG